jgi:fructokinase
MPRSIDVLCTGELLMAFVTADFAHTPGEATLYRRMPAGEVARLGAALARQQLKVHAIAAVGQDELGLLLRQHLEQNGIDISGITQLDEPTTLLLSMRGSEGEKTQVYRGADAQLAIRQFPYARFEDIHWFHTSAFALSRDPARRVIIEACEKAHRAVCRVSLHMNYASCLWPDRAEAQRVLNTYASNSTMVCLTGADWIALQGEYSTPQAVGEHFLKIGAREVLFSPDQQTWWAFSADQGAVSVALKAPVDTEAFLAGFMAQPMEERSTQTRLESVVL